MQTKIFHFNFWPCEVAICASSIFGEKKKSTAATVLVGPQTRNVSRCETIMLLHITTETSRLNRGRPEPATEGRAHEGGQMTSDGSGQRRGC